MGCGSRRGCGRWFSVHKSWGFAGVKLEFVDDGTQAMTNQITDWARTAAKYNLLIDMHDDVKRALFGREPQVTLPFARNIGRPMDFRR